MFSSLFGKLFEVNALAQALTDVNVDVDAANALSNALANNKIDLFKDLALKVLADNNFDVKVKNALLDHCNGCCNGNALIKFTGAASGPIPVISIALICLALIFKEGVPASLTFLILTMIGMGAIMIASIKKTVQEVGTALQVVGFAQESRSVPKSSILSDRDRDIKDMLIIARMDSLQLVREDTRRMCEELSKVGMMHMVTTECRKIIAALDGSIESSKQALSIQGDFENNKRIVAELKALDVEMTKIADILNEQSSALAKVAKFSRKWGNKATSLQSSVMSRSKNLPSRPDFLCTEMEKGSKERVSASIRVLVNKMIDDTNDELDELDTDLEASFSIQTAKSISQQCYKLIKVIAFMPRLQGGESSAIKEQLERKAKLMTGYSDAIEKRSQMEASISNLESRIKLNGETCRQHLAQLESQLDEVQKQQKIQGLGEWIMKGTPPSNDPLAKSLLHYWNTKQFKKLYPYSSGSFSLRLVTEPTAEQRKAFDLAQHLINQIDKLKQDYQSSQVKVWEQELHTKRELLPNFRAAEKIAKKLFDECERDPKGALSWEEFSSKHPIEYSQVSNCVRCHLWLVHDKSLCLCFERLYRYG